MLMGPVLKRKSVGEIAQHRFATIKPQAAIHGQRKREKRGGAPNNLQGGEPGAKIVRRQSGTTTKTAKEYTRAQLWERASYRSQYGPVQEGGVTLGQRNRAVFFAQKKVHAGRGPGERN